MSENTSHTPEKGTEKKPGLLRRLADRSFRASHELPEVDPAPLGYIEGTDIPKQVSTVYIVDPTGEKPTEVRRYRNW